ncbi:MAG TPA: enoyl-CoA hydratase/isomerase family protein [Desulfosarcina sp.]|nr:enoyl-CoA hydratase/isomerase family protein [Desulfosarcina sp.]
MSHLRFIRHDIVDGVATLTFDRPKHNVLNIEMMNELNGQLDTLGQDGSLKCLILAAQGPSWCAGVEVADHKPELVDGMIAAFNGIFERIHRMAVPTIAAVGGACLGGGMEVAMACDIIVASPGAVFGQPEIKLGFFPPYAAIRLPQLVGPARAVEICTTGRRYKAAEAHHMGLVAHLSGKADFQETLESIVAEIRACSPLIIRLNKQAVNAHLGLNFRQALTGVSDLFLNTLMKTEDTLEGIASFEEKRRPMWRNR